MWEDTNTTLKITFIRKKTALNFILANNFSLHKAAKLKISEFHFFKSSLSLVTRLNTINVTFNQEKW